VSGATDTLDPIEAAADDIAGSKDLIASVADEISQHQRWLENYHISETKRARRLKREELMYRLELRRRRTVRSAKRSTLAFLILARRVAAFLVRNGTALLIALRDALVRAAAWTAPRARALALTLWRWASAAWSWTWLNAGILARAFLRATSISASWIAVKSRALALILRSRLIAAAAWTWLKAGILGRSLLKAASLGSTWIVLKSKALAVTLHRQLSAASAWTQVNARILARASRKNASTSFAWTAKTSGETARSLQRSLSASAVWTGAKAHSLASFSRATAAAGFSWAALNITGLSLTGRRAKRKTDSRHRALVVRRCTAVACIEPWRAKLPMVRAD